MGSRPRPAKTRGMPPPDENTVVDPTGAAWVVWLVIVGPGLLFATLACVRRVGPGELVVVVRQGQVVRSRRRGFVARVPGLERFEPVPAGPRVLPLVIRSRTADGVDVVALADLTLEVHDVEAGRGVRPDRGRRTRRGGDGRRRRRAGRGARARRRPRRPSSRSGRPRSAGGCPTARRWPRWPSPRSRPGSPRRMSDTPYLLEVAVSVALLASRHRLRRRSRDRPRPPAALAGEGQLRAQGVDRLRDPRPARRGAAALRGRARLAAVRASRSASCGCRPGRASPSSPAARR